MSIAELQHVQVSDPGGQWSRLEPSDVPTDHALLATNCEFDPGIVSTRKGFAQVWNPAEPINSIYNWISSAGSYLVYYNATSGVVRFVPNLAWPGAVDWYTQAGAAGASIVSGGTRLYIAHFDAAGLGVGQCRVVGKYVAAFNVDKAFLGPLAIKPALTNTGVGSVTAGLKRIGYIIETRNGFLGRISPVNAASNLFDTTSTITAAGGQTIGVSVTATWPIEANRVWFVMTTSDNLDRYYVVPNTVPVGVPGGLLFTVTGTIDLSDADLGSTAKEVTSNNLLFTQDAAGAGPFSPFSVGTFGSRTIYLTEINGVSQGYASEPDNAQTLTADQHVFYLPGFRQMKAQGELGRVLYVLGPHWTYAFEDTGDVPVTWPSPRLVDGAIGTLSPRGFTINASTGFGWAAHVTGLFLFSGGSYASRPISYYVEPDWKRINWAGAAVTVQVVDNKDKQQVYVLAPLDQATQPTHILMFDYSNGIQPEEVKYSLWDIAGYAPGAGCIVQSPTTMQLELWIGNSVAGAIGRQMKSDALPYNDFGAAINMQYETALLPGLNLDFGRIYHHTARQIRATGIGTLHSTLYGLDRTKSQVISDVVLSLTPGQAYTNRFPRLRSESASCRFWMNAPNEWCALSAFDHYFSSGPSYR